MLLKKLTYTYGGYYVMKKRLTALAVLLALTLCSACTDKADSQTEEPSGTASESKITSASQSDGTETGNADITSGATEDVDAEELELSVLRRKIGDAGCDVGIALAEYIEGALSDEDVRSYFKQTPFCKEYPFFADAELFNAGGEQLFLILPQSRTATLELFATSIDENGEMKVLRDDPVCTVTDGAPLILRANEGDVLPSVLAVVTDGDVTREFFPMLSLENAWSVALSDGCFDLTLDDIRRHIGEAHEMLLRDYPEIQSAVDSGYVLIFASDYYLYDQPTVRFELGLSGEDGFVCEKQYAVSFDATYAMDVSDHKWYVLGGGLK